MPEHDRYLLTGHQAEPFQLFARDFGLETLVGRQPLEAHPRVIARGENVQNPRRQRMPVGRFR